jgi:hypothetical protein
MNKSIVALALLLALPVFLSGRFDNRELPGEELPKKEDPVLQLIDSKLVPEPVFVDIQPVAIFQYGDEDVARVGNMEKVDSHLAGLGTMVRLPDGAYCVITAEHLFTKHKEVNYSCQRYAVKVLREEGALITRNIVSAQPFFKDRAGLIDVAVCMVGQNRSVKIQPFSPFSGGGGKSESYSEHKLCVGDPEDKVVLSLVTGEKATLLCMDEIPGASNAYYFLISYRSIPGESGTGFVDRRGNLYVLKGSIIDKDVASVSANLKEMGVTTGDTKGYSLVAGPFSIKTK